MYEVSVFTFTPETELGGGCPVSAHTLSRIRGYLPLNISGTSPQTANKDSYPSF